MPGTFSLTPGLAILLLGGCATGPPSPPPEEWDRELPAEIRLVDFEDEDDGATTHIPVRVVEDATGAPIAGARIDGWWEAGTPGAEPWEDLLDQSVLTDGDGWALVRTKDRASWFYVEAEGFAPYGEMSLDEEYRLIPGVDVEVEVRDPLDRPLPGAVLEHMLGCGHTPNARVETTDAAGRCVFRCVDPERGYLWVRGEGIAGRNPAYDSGFDGLEWDGARWILRGDPGPVVEGRVLHADGRPAAGVTVGAFDAHRGPWTSTDAAGRFRLLGAEPWGSCQVRTWITEEESTLWTEFDTVPGVPTTVRLPADSDLYENGEMRPPAEGEEPPSLLVRIEAPPGLDPPGSVRVALVREEDGLSWSADVAFEDGAAERSFEVLPGRWRVASQGGAGPLARAVTTVEVGAGDAEATLRPGRAPTRRVRLLRNEPTPGDPVELPSPWPGELSVVREDGRYPAVAAPGGEGEYFVPADGDFLLEYEEEGFVGRLRVERSAEGDLLTLVADPVPPPPPMEMMSLPYEGDFPAARLTVLLSDGSPAAGADVVIRGSTAPNMHYSVQDSLDESGSLEYAFRRHDRVEVRTGDDAHAPLVHFVDGPGPWTLRWPATTVEVRAVDGAGAPVEEFGVVVGGWNVIDAVDGVVRLRGAAAGPLRFWVQAPGRRARELRLRVAEGETRGVTTVLR